MLIKSIFSLCDIEYLNGFKSIFDTPKIRLFGAKNAWNRNRPGFNASDRKIFTGLFELVALHWKL